MPTYGWVIIAIAAVVVFFLLRRKKQKAIDNSWQADSQARIWKVYNTGVKFETAAGHTLHYEAGLEHLASIGPAVAEGVDRCLTKFECSYPNVDRTRHHVHAVVLQPELDEHGNPAFRVAITSSDPYYNSDFDKMKGSDEHFHYILVAGQTVAAGEPYGDVFAFGYGENADYIAQVTEYEMEHVALAYYDGEKYEVTKYHADGTGHPLVANCPGERPVGLMSRSLSVRCAGATKSAHSA